MRPCGPEPRTRTRSMPASAASRRASGVTTVPPGKSRRAEIALGRAHLEERIERTRRRWPTARDGAALRRDDRLARSVRRCGRRSPAWQRVAPAERPSSRGRGLPSAITATTAPTGATSPAHDADFGEHAGRGRRHLHRHLVGLDLEQIVARLDVVAGRLEPLGDLALGDGLAELRHQDVHVAFFPRRSRTPVSLEPLPGRPHRSCPAD